MSLASKMYRLLNENVAVEGIFVLPTWHPSRALMDCLDRYEELPEEFQQFVKGWDESQIEDLLDGNEDAWEHFTQTVVQAGWCGFMVEAVTPVKTKCGDYTTFSWGYTRHKTIIHTDLDAAMDLACDWAESMSSQVEA